MIGIFVKMIQISPKYRPAGYTTIVFNYNKCLRTLGYC